MKTFTFRASLVALALTGALSAHAAIRYEYSDAVESFSFTTPTFITTATSFDTSGFDSASSNIPFISPVVDATFTPTTTPGSGTDQLTFHYYAAFAMGLQTQTYDFAPGAFGTLGSHDSVSTFPATLTVTQAVPEPASLAILALPAVALLRRRRAARGA